MFASTYRIDVRQSFSSNIRDIPENFLLPEVLEDIRGNAEHMDVSDSQRPLRGLVFLFLFPFSFRSVSVSVWRQDG